MARSSTSGIAKVTERACWVLACVLLGLYVAVRTDAAVNGRADLAKITLNVTPVLSVTSAAESSDAAAPPASVTDPVASLEIPSLGLRTALYSDTGEVNLNRGAGLIQGMAGPGQGGNLGVAAHRDGIFKPIENIAIGARVEVHTMGARYVYHVTSITVVERTDAALLQRTDAPSITLVTCYPFRFVGPAPRRFVVRGLLDSSREAAANMTQPPRERVAAI